MTLDARHDRDRLGAEEQLADDLAALLQEEEGRPSRPTAEALETAEARDLAALGLALQAHADDLALAARAEALFDDQFAQRLRHTLLEAHPAALQQVRAAVVVATPTIAVADTRAAAATVSQRWVHSSLRRLSLLGAVMMALLLALVVVIQSTLHQPVFHGALVSSTATAAPHPFAVRAAPGRSTPTPRRAAVMAPLVGGASPATQPAGSIAPLSKAPLVYQLPAHLPALPGAAVLFDVRFKALSQVSIQSIVASFPELARKPAPPGSGLAVYAHGQETLQIAAATGKVSYTRSIGIAETASPTLSNATAIAAAQRWLRQHRLYPPAVDTAHTTVISEAGSLQVYFMPVVPRPAPVSAYVATASPASLPDWLVVYLGPRGVVSGAVLAWPSFQQSALRVLAGLRTAAHVAGMAVTPGAAPGAQLLRVTAVRLVYTQQVAVDGSGETLVPAYLLSGTLVAPDGTQQPSTAMLRAPGS